MRANSSADLRVFVVWEPVLTTDWGTPSPSLTGYVPDSRAVHFWDRDHRLSAALGGVTRLHSLARAEGVGFRMKDVIWDAALVYPPDAKWGDPAQLLVAPVVSFHMQLSDALSASVR